MNNSLRLRLEEEKRERCEMWWSEEEEEADKRRKKEKKKKKNELSRNELCKQTRCTDKLINCCNGAESGL